MLGLARLPGAAQSTAICVCMHVFTVRFPNQRLSDLYVFLYPASCQRCRILSVTYSNLQIYTIFTDMTHHMSEL